MCPDCDAIMELARADYERRMATGDVESRLTRSGLPVAYTSGKRTLLNIPSASNGAVKACADMGAKITGLYLWGAARSFKTSVACAYLASQIRDGKRGTFVSTPKLMDDITASYHDDDTTTRAAIIAAHVSTPLLVLDDFGKEKATEHSARVLFEILDGRWQAQTPERWTIITSNYSPNDIVFRFDIPEQDRDPIRHRLAELTRAVEMERRS